MPRSRPRGRTRLSTRRQCGGADFAVCRRALSRAKRENHDATAHGPEVSAFTIHVFARAL
jgi:hypothetical protein